MIASIGEIMQKSIEQNELGTDVNEIPEQKRFFQEIERNRGSVVELPDILFIENTSRSAFFEQCLLKISEVTGAENIVVAEIKTEKLTEDEKTKIKEETGWSDEIIDNIKNMTQYEILKNAGLIEAEINGRKCLIKENIDINYTDDDGISNRDRIARGLAPLDSKTGKPIELHHLGQKVDSPLVEFTEEEHRTGEYENGKKNQSLWHDNTKGTEVHGDGNSWDQERKAYWKARAEQSKE